MENTSQLVMDYIRNADDVQINDILQAITRRYQAVHPDWDITFLSLPKNDPEERKRLLQYALSIES